jgi:hypothetical protein
MFGLKGARKMSFGRPMRRWKGNIEIYLKEL